MPRTNRIKDNFGIYYIQQQGGEDKEIFSDGQDRDFFLGLIERSKKKNGCKVLALSLDDSNEYHLVVQANGNDISKIMKEINIAYSIYKRCEGCLYKDRFKSILINNKETLEQKMCEIHDRAKQSTDRYNSRYCYEEQGKPSPIVDVTAYRQLAQRCKSGTLELKDCSDCITTVAAGKEFAEKKASRMGKTLDELIIEKKERNRLMKELKKCSTLSLKEIGEIMNGLSGSAVCKILNS